MFDHYLLASLLIGKSGRYNFLKSVSKYNMWPSETRTLKKEITYVCLSGNWTRSPMFEWLWSVWSLDHTANTIGDAACNSTCQMMPGYWLYHTVSRHRKHLGKVSQLWSRMRRVVGLTLRPAVLWTSSLYTFWWNMDGSQCGREEGPPEA